MFADPPPAAVLRRRRGGPPPPPPFEDECVGEGAADEKEEVSMLLGASCKLSAALPLEVPLPLLEVLQPLPVAVATCMWLIPTSVERAGRLVAVAASSIDTEELSAVLMLVPTPLPPPPFSRTALPLLPPPPLAPPLVEALPNPKMGCAPLLRDVAAVALVVADGDEWMLRRPAPLVGAG